jgi:hypothetical protein
LLRIGSFQSNGRQDRGAAYLAAGITKVPSPLRRNFRRSTAICTLFRIRNYNLHQNRLPQASRIDTKLLHGHKMHDDFSHFGPLFLRSPHELGFERDRKQPAQTQYLGDAVLFRHSANMNSIGTACR